MKKSKKLSVKAWCVYSCPFRLRVRPDIQLSAAQKATFPLFSKTKVNGSDAHPVFKVPTGAVSHRFLLLIRRARSS